MKLLRRPGLIWMNKGKHSAYRRRQIRSGLLFAAPVLGGTLLFFGVPFCMVVLFSFGLGGGQSQFVGLQNYVRALESESFRLAVWNTVRFLALGVPLVLTLALSLALLLHNRPRFNCLCSNTILLPLVLPLASIVMLVEFLIPDRTMDGPGAFWILLALYVWKNCGYLSLLLLAARNMVPEEYYQYAQLSGANEFQQLRYVTLPQLRPALGFTSVIAVINSFKSYREAFLLGGKHPTKSIYLLQHFLNNNFENLNYARLSVASVLLAVPIVLTAVIVLIQWRRRGDET